jgi:N-acetylmuramoyl-L-alanine amidase
MIAFAYYLLKVIICSGVLFLYYHITLRNKLFHQWNRFYLLIAVVISLVAPVIQLSIVNYNSEATNKAIQILQVFQSADGYLEEVTVRGRQGISIEQWLMMVYLLMCAVLLVNLVLSLQKIFSIIKSHTIQWVEKIKFINTRASNTPFSFFNFIFWNEEISLHSETGQQIFQHELVHVKEKHTLDKLFVQVILIIFWCNPFFWLIRRELRLIHEFIADKKAVGEHGTAALAAMILSAAYPARFNSITNQFFQTSIKRRLAMLTKNQNPRISYLGRLSALLILVSTALAFTLRTKNVVESNAKLDGQLTVVIDAGHGILSGGKPSGVVIRDVNEDAIVLAISKKIKQQNTNDKIKIILTRASEEIIDLRKRVEIAKENNADLFVSLHIDAVAENQEAGMSSDKTLTNGFGIYVSNKKPVYQQQSELLGSVLREELNSIYPTNPYLLKRNVGIWVLDQNVCPSVLVECGFLTDEKDRKFITNSNNQNAIAQKILLAIERYADSYQKTPKAVDTVPKKPKTLTNVKLSEQGAKTSTTSTENPPLFMVDGKEVSKAEAYKLDPSSIESINILKDNTATDKYGKKGTNGAVEIKLKQKKSNADITFQQNGSTIGTGQISLDTASNSFHGTIHAVQNMSPDSVPKNEALFTKVEVEPSIDRQKWSQFLQQNLQSFVRNAASNGIDPGTYIVNVRFIVKKDGSLSDFTALNDPGYGMAKKVVEMIKDSPRWKPGMQNGRPVNSYHTQPITLVIQTYN